MWGTSNDDLYLVGDSGLIMHYDGSAWQRMESGTTIDLWNIWGLSSNDIWVVGHCALGCSDPLRVAGIVLHYDGTKWQTVIETMGEPIEPDKPRGSMSAVWSSDQTLFVAAGSGVYRESLAYGTGRFKLWFDIAFPVGFSFDMHGLADNDLFIVGDFGSILHWNGASWRHYPFFDLNSVQDLRAVSMAPNGEVFAVGRGPNGAAAVYHGKR